MRSGCAANVAAIWAAVSHAICVCAHVAASARSGIPARAIGGQMQDPRALALLAALQTHRGIGLDRDQHEPGQQARPGRHRRTVGPRQLRRVELDQRKEVRLGVACPGGRRHAQHLPRLDGQHVARPGQRHCAGDVARGWPAASSLNDTETFARAGIGHRRQALAHEGQEEQVHDAASSTASSATVCRVHFRSTARDGAAN